MSNNVYFTEWQSKFGASWRLEVQSPDDTLLSNPNYIKFPKQAISLEDFGWEFDDIPLGIMSDTALSVSWALSEIADLTELKDFLFNPTRTIAITTSIAPDITAGNLYTLYRNNDIVYKGIQLRGYQYGLMVASGVIEYKAELKGLGKYILSCFDLPEFNNSFLVPAISLSKPAKYVIEQAINKGIPNNMTVPLIKTIINAARFKDVHERITSNNNDVFYFMSLANFESYMKYVFQDVYNKLTRTENAVIEFELPFMKYYEQTLNASLGTSPAVGATLTKETAYSPAIIKRDGGYIGGFVYKEQGIGIYKVFYDFLADMATDHITKYQVSPTGSKFKPYCFFSDIPYSTSGFGESPTAITISTKEVLELELEHYIVNQVTASLEEFTNEDVDNYRFNDGTLRNDDELQVPILFNSAPPVNKYELIKSERDKILDNSFINSVGKLDVTGDALRVFRYYYFTTPSFLTSEVAVAAHSFCRQASGIGSDMYDAGNAATLIDDTKAWILSEQKQCSKPMIFSDFRAVLDSPRNSKLKIKVPATSDFNKIFDGINTAFYLDLTKWDSYLSNYPDTWYLTKVEYSFEDDCFSLELFGSWAGSR